MFRSIQNIYAAIITTEMIKLWDFHCNENHKIYCNNEKNFPLTLMSLLMHNLQWNCWSINDLFCPHNEILIMKEVVKGFWFKFHWSLFPINNIVALVQLMAWCRRPSNKPLSEPMMVYQHTYASLGLNDSTDTMLTSPYHIFRGPFY